jgi:pimeloyl-ACP methyl ester carboxylesterase
MARKHEARFAAEAKRARVETIAGAGHACSLEQPEAFDHALREFLGTEGPPWSGTAVHRASRARV